MQKRSYKLISPRSLQRASWLSLLSLAWLQLTMASHQFDHVAEYYFDTCHVCAQLDRADDTVDSQLAQAPVVAGPSSERVTISQGAISRPSIRHFDSRAPPRL